MPTLLDKGNLRSTTNNVEEQAKLDNIIPIDYILDWLRKRESRAGLANRVLIVIGRVASGKSTVIPSYIYHDLVAKRIVRAGGIACTQPRSLTAIMNVLGIISLPVYSFLRLGETIGWETKYNKLRPKSYAFHSLTVGTLLMQLQTLTDDEIIQRYRYILIDEVHTRDLTTDMTISMMHSFLNRQKDNPRCPFLLLMSATLEPTHMLAYFGGTLESNVIICEGQSYPRKTEWDWGKAPVKNLSARIAETIAHIVELAPKEDANRADILVFLPGKAELADAKKAIVEKAESQLFDKFGDAILPIIIDSTSQRLKTADFVAFETPHAQIRHPRLIRDGVSPPISRKVILSTNIAETGLTLDQLKYVIDSGFDRGTEFHPRHGVKILLTKGASIANITQRYGRCARKFPGVCYPLYSKRVFDELLPAYKLPEIVVGDISEIILHIIIAQQKAKFLQNHSPKTAYFHVSDLSMLDMPSPDAIHLALEKMQLLGFISFDAPPFELDAEAFISKNKEQTSSEASSQDLFGVPMRTFPLAKLGITRLGRLANEVLSSANCSPEAVRLILAGYAYKFSIIELIDIAAYTSVTASELMETEVGKPQSAIERDSLTRIYADIFEDDSAFDKMREISGDEFMDIVFIIYSLKQYIARSPPERMNDAIQEWCAAFRINISGIINILTAREAITNALLAQRMHISKNSGIIDACFGEKIASPISRDNIALLAAIIRLKRCLYEGYKMNIARLRLDPSEGAHNRSETAHKDYRTRSGLIVGPPKLTNPPKVFLFDSLFPHNSPKKVTMIVTAMKVSSLDGFIAEDPGFAK
ncbi:MAG: hypothetical protein M0R33_15200 [Methylomonas sp.]|jgi:HrpA-like RNA helicase|uniref:helicase-related protein n=1 Tax=Methylomonas sp. TaxID=418 RepID=UPI0025ED10DB|nr:helicase-related protein [Methylomonas sp.]MCK9607788.1 hypothetical protein [Methylomonas sp.]